MTAVDATLTLPHAVPAPAGTWPPATAAPPTTFGFSATFGLAAFVFLAAAAVANIASYGFLPTPANGPDTLHGARGALKGLLVAAAIVGLLVPIVVRGTQGWTVSDYLALKRPRLRHLVLSIGGIILFWISIIATWRLGGIERAGDDWVFTTYQKALSNGFLPLLWLSNVIAAPVAEEILFRGFIYRGLLHTRLRSSGAVLLTAAAFAAIHQQYDAVGVAAIFVLGLVLGWLRQRTGSTIVPMFVHAIQNLGATALAAGLLV